MQGKEIVTPMHPAPCNSGSGSDLKPFGFSCMARAPLHAGQKASKIIDLRSHLGNSQAFLLLESGVQEALRAMGRPTPTGWEWADDPKPRTVRIGVVLMVVIRAITTIMVKSVGENAPTL
jgi:hypothetical protein